MFERFTDRARRVVVLAQEEARLLDHGYIGTEHLLLGLIHEGEGVAARVLERLEISLLKVRSEVEEIIGRGGSAPVGHIPFTARAKKVLEMSLREALALGHNYIGTEHILLGLVREGEGVAAVVLVKLGADLQRVREAVTGVVGGDVVLAAPLPGPGRYLRLRLRSGRIDLSIEDLAFSALPSLEVVVREPEAVARGSRDLFDAVRRIVGEVGQALEDLEAQVAFEDAAEPAPNEPGDEAAPGSEQAEP